MTSNHHQNLPKVVKDIQIWGRLDKPRQSRWSHDRQTFLRTQQGPLLACLRRKRVWAYEDEDQLVRDNPSVARGPCSYEALMQPVAISTRLYLVGGKRLHSIILGARGRHWMIPRVLRRQSVMWRFTKWICRCVDEDIDLYCTKWSLYALIQCCLQAQSDALAGLKQRPRMEAKPPGDLVTWFECLPPLFGRCSSLLFTEPGWPD